MEHFSIITTREFLNKIGNKSFILMTILLPIILSGIGFLLTFLSSINNDTSKVISVVDKTGYIYEKLDSSNDIKYDLIGSSNSLDEARSISESKSDYGLLFIDNFDTHIDPNDPTNNCLDVAIITAPEKRSQKTKDKLKTVAGRVLNK